jgi:hypothetical protein
VRLDLTKHNRNMCALEDRCFNFGDYVGTPKFVSTCASLECAQTLAGLNPTMPMRCPAPLADRIVELEVSGRVIKMVYDDRTPGDKKRFEDETIVPLDS